MRPDDCHFVEPFETDECEMINLCFSEEILNKIIDFYDRKLDFDKILNSVIPVSVQLTKAEHTMLYQKFDALNVLNLTDETTFKINLLYLLNELIISSYFVEFINSTKYEEIINSFSKYSRFILNVVSSVKFRTLSASNF